MHPGRIAERHRELMAVLGYDSYLAQGGDWGSPITVQTALADPAHCRAIHLNIALAAPPRDAVAPLPQGEVWVWDTELKGFFLRVYSSGRKVYAVKCRVGTRQRIHTIGVHGSPWTPEEAKQHVDELKDLLEYLKTL